MPIPLTTTGFKAHIPAQTGQHLRVQHTHSIATISSANKLAASCPLRYNRYMSRNPFKPTKDQSTEFGFGPGSFPDSRWDFSEGGYKSGFPIADPDRSAQLKDLRAAKRTDLNNPNEPDLPAFQGGHGPAAMHYAEGNTERYGAQPPIVRATRKPTFPRMRTVKPSKMVREP